MPTKKKKHETEGFAILNYKGNEFQFYNDALFLVDNFHTISNARLNAYSYRKKYLRYLKKGQYKIVKVKVIEQ